MSEQRHTDDVWTRCDLDARAERRRARRLMAAAAAMAAGGIASAAMVLLPATTATSVTVHGRAAEQVYAEAADGTPVLS